MDFDKVLRFVDPRQRADLLTFLKTGIPDVGLEALINENVFCQQAIEIFLRWQNELLLLAEFQQRIAAKLRHVKPQWHAEFIRFMATGDFSKEFLEYAAADPECYELLGSIIEEQKQKDAEAARQKKNSRPKPKLPPVEEFTLTLENHRQRWARLDNL